MTDKDLETNEEHATTFKHPVTGETFHELAAAHLAQCVKRNPSDVARVKRVAWRFPGLAEALLAHFPNDEDLEWGGTPPPNARDANDYISAVGRARCEGGPRVCNMLHDAEKRAGRIAIIADENVNDAEAHLREERIDALASLIALFSLPDRFAASPVEPEDDDADAEPVYDWIAKRAEGFAAWQIARRSAMACPTD